jgi:hypothetical protein
MESAKIRGVGLGFLYAGVMTKPTEPIPGTKPSVYDLAASEGRSGTKFRLQLVVVNDSGHEPVQEMARIEREGVEMETLGLTLAEGKLILKKIQEGVVQGQIHDALARWHKCPDCGQARQSKGHHDVTIRTLFGNVELKSPRLEHCRCQPHEEKTFSPLQTLLPEHTSPEMLYLEVKWSSLLPYAVSCDLLHDVLPVNEKLSAVTIRNHLFEVAERMEKELGEERPSLIEGCEQDGEQLPLPDGPLTVGLDGGFVRARHKRGCFEVIAGKSVLEFKRQAPEAEKSRKCFGFVQTYDTKPRRRIFELLKSQGLAMNQQVTFLSDGGDDVRQVQQYLNPEAEYWLDWFHITMRITVMKQMSKGLAKEVKAPAETDSEPAAAPPGKSIENELQSLKWNLWHGNVERALERIEDLQWDLELTAGDSENRDKLLKQLREFDGYIRNNRDFIPNYGERYRNGERIATGFVESTVNQVVSKRMVKRQQMQWTERGAHLLLQTRTRVLNGELDETFRRWYPKFRLPIPLVLKAAA